MSLSKSGRIWASDELGNLVQADLLGNIFQKIKTTGGCTGYHTVTQDMDLIYTEEEKNIINRITKDNIVTKFIKRDGWKPLSIHSTKFNGDILVRMITDFVAKVTRYNKSGKEIQNIQKDNKGLTIYGYHYTLLKITMVIFFHQTGK